MGTKNYRIALTFDVDKEADLIAEFDSLSSSKKLGPLASNLLRAAFDGHAKNNEAIQKLTTSTLSPNRAAFFNGIAQRIKEQDKKIDTIYDMCSELYGLARMNRVVGLESKADNLMASMFVLQRQQSKLKEVLGDGNFNHMYESEKLLNEKEKADKIMEYIMTVYVEIIAELKPQLVMQTTPVVQYQMAPNEPPKQTDSIGDDGEEYIDLVERPTAPEPPEPPEEKKDPYVIDTPDADVADFLSSLMDGM